MAEPLAPFLLDGRLDLRGFMNSKDFQNLRWKILRSKFTWHKFTILDIASLEKDYVLRLVIDACRAPDFMPIGFHMEDNDGVFYARDCAGVIEVLLRQNLIITHVRHDDPNNPLVQLTMLIELATSDRVDEPPSVFGLVSDVLTKRYDAETATLNLSEFHNDPELVPHIFYPLTTSRHLCDVLIHVGGLRIEHLNLANNKLEDLEMGRIPTLSALKTLNLAHNKLSLDGLDPLKSMPISEVTLDGNPLCAIFADHINEYVCAIRNLFPFLEKLDGIRLNEVGPPRLLRSFLTDVSQKPLVQEFVRHYFSLYDSPHRQLLAGLYHAEAQLSVSVTVVQAQMSFANARIAGVQSNVVDEWYRLSTYMQYNRNLQRISDYSKFGQLVHIGSASIMELLNKLPVTKHDPTSFTADLTLSTDTCRVLSVTGVFREPENPSASLRHFRRQFTMVPLQVQDGEIAYQIINELFFVSNTTNGQDEHAFPPQPERSGVMKREKLPIYLLCQSSSGKRTRSEKRDMLDYLAEATDMNKLWCRKCLNDVNWDIRAALILFSQQYKENSIAPEAFFKQKTPAQQHRG